MRSFPLSVTASVVLNGSGAGTVQLGPSLPREVWRPAKASVQCSATVTSSVCQATIYSGPQAAQAYFRDATQSADTGDSTDAVAADELRPGTYVWAVFSAGVAAATATLTVTGIREVP